MSPARSKRQAGSRTGAAASDIVKAVAVAAGIVLGTVVDRVAHAARPGRHPGDRWAR